MNFEVKIHEDENVGVFKLLERSLDANISGLVKGEFTILIANDGVSRLVIDLTGVETCDSSGLSALLVANRLLGAKNGELRIVCPSEKILSLIKITQLDRVLSLSNSVEEAVSELSEE
ncbi:Anti-sigma-B factor antagonist [uncultured bacterium]|nr:Anti-sigma-B factor antagonist [uncultured bacterium]